MQCLSAGDAHTAVVRTSDGALFTCGENYLGQLGHGNIEDRSVLTRVEGPLLSKRVVAVSTGDSHMAAITDDGEIYTWGTGHLGQLGHGNEREVKLVPTQVQSMRGKRAVAVSCGWLHTAAVTDDGELYVWGNRGAWGLDTNEDAFTPSRVGGALLGERVVAVSAGFKHTAVVTAAGGVYTFGGGANGKLGHGDIINRTVPTLVGGELQGRIAVAVSAGVESTAVVMQGGELYTFGAGPATGHRTQTSVPKLVTALQGKQVVSVSSWCHTVGVTVDGECYTWGGGDDGRLGHGDERTRHTPRLIHALLGKRVVAVAAGETHTAAMTAEGDLFMWGGASDALGLGIISPTSVDQLVPTLVPRVGEIPWYTAPTSAAATDEERLPDAYVALSTLMRDTNLTELDDDALADFNRRITRVRACVRAFNDELAAKCAGVESEMNHRACAEAVAKATPDFACPISHALMRDPVMAADGNSYERREIEQWFAGGHVKSPLTGADMPNTTLFPNITLRKIIKGALEAEMAAAGANGGGGGAGEGGENGRRRRRRTDGGV